MTSGGTQVRMTRLPPAFDLLAACAGGRPATVRFLFEREGLGVAGAPISGGISHGAEPISEDIVSALGRSMVARLRGFPVGSGSVPMTAVGQIPFGPVGTARLQAPTRLVRRTAPGETWLQDVFPSSDDGADDLPPFEPVRPALGGPSAPFATTQVRADPPADAYGRSVSTAVERIRAGALEKVVLARTMQVAADRTLDPVRLAARLRAVDPQAYTFIAPVTAAREAHPVLPLLVGASPELLVSRRGRSVRSTPLAGSAPRSGDPEEDRANA
ncbi:MAG TPA: chorismate-binding protein, partial [Actinomycetota bacterium]